MRFYVDTPGSTTLRDAPDARRRPLHRTRPRSHQRHHHPRTGSTERHPRGAIDIRFSTDDAGNAHAALTAAGVDTDEILRWLGVPAKLSFRDPDGNALSVTEAP